MKKKLISLLMSATIVAALLSGCAVPAAAPAATDSAAPAATTTDSAEVYNVGICQLVEHVALDAATQGFKDAITAKLGDKVVFDEQNAQGDSATCATIINSFVSANKNLIMANATPPLQAAAAGTVDIPILGTSVTDYATALDITDWNGSTGRNISGTSDLAPLSEQAAIIKELFPNAANVGILYCSAEANSQYQADVMKAELEKLGLSVEYYSFVDTNDVATVTTKAVEACDVIFIPTDNTAASNTGIIDGIARPAGIPIVAGEEGICSGCGVATLSISYYDLGYATGEMAVEILANGKDVKDLPIQYAPNVTKKYNATIASELGIEIPEDYVAIEQ